MSVIQTRVQPPRLTGPSARPGGHSDAGAASGITARELLRIIRKRKWLILLTWLVSMGVVVLVTALWQLYAPFYTASALLAVSPTEQTLTQITRAPLYTKDIIDRYKRTQAALVKQQDVLEDASRDRRVTSKRWYTRHRERIIQELDDEVGVSVLPETDFIQLSMTGVNKDELADIINAVADSFIKFAGQGARREIDDEIRKLQGQVDDLRSRLDQRRRDLAAAIGASPIAAMQEHLSLVSLKLQQLVHGVGEAEVAQSHAEAAMKAHQDELRTGNVSKNFQVQQSLDMDPNLRGMKVRLAELQTALDNVMYKFGPGHRSVQSIKGMVDTTSRQIEDKQKEITQTTAEAIGQMRQMELAMTTAQLADLTDRLNQAKAEAKDLEVALGRIGALRQEILDVEQNTQRLEQAIMERQVRVRGGENIGPVTVGAYARIPREPSQPKWVIMIPLGVVLGMVLGFGLAFLLELADTSVRTPSDIARRINFPLLGMVPHTEDLEEEIPDVRRLVQLAPHSPGAEAFRQIRTNLLFSGPAQQRRSLLVTSPAPEDGRTTVVMNLAVCMAQSGRKVLVVDANFRQPAISGMFPTAPAGLSSALVGQAAWRDVVSPTDTPNLSVIASGPLPPNPADLLGSDQMRQLISEMTAEYDQVIFDGSPVMVVSDAAVLATQVDGVILVIRAGTNSIGIVQRSAEQLSRVGAHVIGVVLQAVRSTAGGYLRKNYQTFYEYQQKPLP